MLREILRDNLDQLLLSVSKIAHAFDLIARQEVEKEDLLMIKRLIHSLKGNLQAIGLHDDAQIAIELEETVFSFMDRCCKESCMVSKYTVDEWFTYLNKIEFSLKSYMF